MIFGKREVRKTIGSFGGDGCAACTEGDEYSLIRITKYLVVFFINLIPLKSRYEKTCVACSDSTVLDLKDGNAIARNEFGLSFLALNAAAILKLTALALIIAAAVVLPLALAQPASLSPQALKDLVTAEGLYSIQDAQGHVFGIVEMTGSEKKLTFYEKSTVLVGEPGADGSFIRREYYQEAQTDTASGTDVSLEPIADNPGILEDKYGTVVRLYYYDAANGIMGYAKGITDLSTVIYAPDKVYYPFTYFSTDSEPKDVAVMLYLQPSRRIEASFVSNASGADQLALLIVKSFDKDRITQDATYTFDSAVIALAVEAGINRESTADEIMAFVEKNALTPANQLTYQYYENTKVYTSVGLDMPDSSGVMQSVSQPYQVTVKNGYYIQQVIES